MPKPLDEIMAEGVLKAYEWSDFWSAEDARAVMRAGLAELEKEGYVVVPLKPTEAMKHATDEETGIDISGFLDEYSAEQVWETMLTARPGISHPQAPYTPEPRKEKS